MIDVDPAPYAELTPHRALDAVDAQGFVSSGALLQLNSYENRVIQASLDDGRVLVAKFYRPGRWSDAQILEEHAFAAELAEAEVPVAAPLALGGTSPDWRRLAAPGRAPTLAVQGKLRLGLTARLGGRPPELGIPDVLHRIGQFLGRIHVVGAARPFEARVSWADSSPGWQARSSLLDGGWLESTGGLRWAEISARALELAATLFAAHADASRLRLHGDCHPGNILWSEQHGPQFVDLDDACMGPAVQDFWMLLSGDPRTRVGELSELIDGYEMFRRFDRRELGLIEPLRTLRMIHHVAWLAARWADPAFPVAFGWFGESGVWDQQARALEGQIDAMNDAADAAPF